MILCLSSMDNGLPFFKKHFVGPVNILGNAAEDIFFKSEGPRLRAIDKYIQHQANRPYLLSVANYSALKNQVGIFKAFAKAGLSNLDLVFIGSKKNSYYLQVEDAAQNFNELHGTSHRVYALTGVNRNDIPSIMNQSEIYLVGSTTEAYSISIIEALSQGVPFISTNTGNARVLPGGLIVDSIVDMTDAIVKLLSNKKKYAKLSAEGKRFAELNCRVDQVVDLLETYLNKVESGKG